MFARNTLPMNNTRRLIAGRFKRAVKLCGMEKTEPFGRSITEARGIIEEISGSKKMNSGTMNRKIRGTYQSPSGFMIAYRQEKGM